MTVLIRMIDATHVNVPAIPPGIAKVGGYVTGSPNIRWDQSDWARFPLAGHIRIDQGFDGNPQPAQYDVLDCEAGALTPGQVADQVKMRINAGIQWTTVYGSDAPLADVQRALEALGRTWYYGHVDCWLADYNLSETEASALVGTEVHGLTCRAVQWASPASNPNTRLACNGELTLSSAQVDLSVADRSWHSDNLCQATFL